VNRPRLSSIARLLKRPPRHARTPTRAETYDSQTFEVMGRVLSTDSIAVDVGAYEGTILAEIVRLAPRGRHFAFEPIPGLAADLRRRFPSVHVCERALTNSVGSAAFELVVDAPAYSGLRRREYDVPDPTVQRIVVDTDTLDDVIPQGVPVAFMKIDVEGGEYHVLLGGLSTLERCRPVIVFEAAARSTGCYGVTASDLYQLVTRRLGMRLFTMARWLRGAEGYSAEEFDANWVNGPDFYFIAYG